MNFEKVPGIDEDLDLDPYISRFQKDLRRWRVQRGISQTELANAIGVSQGHLSYVERGLRDLTQAKYEDILDYFSKKE